MEEMGSDTSSQNALASPSSSPLDPLLSALVAIAIAQSIKFFYAWYKERRWDFKQLVRSGGMPSSHSAGVTALGISIGCQADSGVSLLVAAAFVTSLVIYGESGQWLYHIFPAELPLADGRPLRELVRRTTAQAIVGCLLGIFTAVIGHLIILLASQS